ncbi:hypothetical protein PAHAL_4G295300 [Panicum hallii]|uniref:Uncharacterized protein n=1 Tax=Panicum hallii TaxID=206008 RepID=A0A2T8JEB3_9POAL|nr:hypothetical protein PAHAL_4G295300 [Panicum hallii]
MILLWLLIIGVLKKNSFLIQRCSLEHHPSRYLLTNNPNLLPHFMPNWFHFKQVHSYCVLHGYSGHVDVFFVGTRK